MKILLDVNDDKAFYLFEVLKNIPYVKAQQLTDYKAEVLSELREAVEELNKVKLGTESARDVNEFLNEL